jgi:Cu/Ag efflux pump CusA
LSQPEWYYDDLELPSSDGARRDALGKEMIIRGSLERLAPVMITAMTSFIGLIPLLFGHGEPGKEILYPLSVVVFGGKLAATLLDQLITPALFYLFGSKST